MMNRSSRLKTANPWMLGLAGITLVFILGTVFAFSENHFQALQMAIMSWAFITHLVIIVRTRNPVYIVSLLFYLFAALTSLSVLIGFRTGIPYFASAALIMFAAFIYTLVKKKIKWYYRDTLELAARPVETAEDGFTPRPWPAGSVDFTSNEILKFARFMKKYAIVVPYVEKYRVVFVVPENILKHFFIPWQGYGGTTWVAFDFDNKMTVNIAQKDYNRYREELTFDKLCASFGDMFRTFLEMHRNGDQKKILELLNNARG
ncbi:MAG: hypothetical protein KOO63_02505 [Bacteroidales bacterium]|nr:hypothetical protein [Candidatus Latescibacterota bacterium]